MNHKTLPALIIALLALASTATADYELTYPEQGDDQIDVDVSNATVVSAESTRAFTIDNATDVPVFIQLVANEGDSPWLDDDDYSVDLYLSLDNGTTYTQVGAAVNHTDPTTSVAMNSTHQGSLKAVLNFPEDRSLGVIPLELRVVLDEAADTGGTNGATENPSLRHDIRLHFYDAATDADADTLPDAWEIRYFGSAETYNAGDDPDGDGWNNGQEYAEGTNPTNGNDHPAEPVIPGPGGGNVDSNELGLASAGAFLFGLIALAGTLVIVDQGRKRRHLTDKTWVFYTVGIGTVLLVAFLVPAALDGLDVGSAKWSFWKFVTGWQEWVIFSFGSAVILIGGALAAGAAAGKGPKGDQKADQKIALATTAGVVAWGGLIWLFYGMLGLPVPFLG